MEKDTSKSPNGTAHTEPSTNGTSQSGFATNAEPHRSRNERSGTPPPTGEEDSRPQRAAHACHRCRRMKLRCTGGIPCARCKRAKQPCDGETSYDVLDVEAQASLRRIAELEDLVRELVQKSQPGGSVSQSKFEIVQEGAADAFASAIAGSSVAATVPGLLSHSVGPAMPNVRFDLPSNSHTSGTEYTRHDVYTNAASAGPSTHGFQDGMFPLTSHTRQSAIQPSEMMPPQSFNAMTSISPQYGSNALQGGEMSSPAPPAPRDSPASRLAVAQDSSIMQPPFRPLLIRSKVWDNKQPSRPGSPSSNEDAWYFEGRAGPQSDPVSEMIVDLELAKQLFDFYYTNSHHFLPIIHFTRHDVDRHTEIRQRSPFLYTVILAIGARHYQRSKARSGMTVGGVGNLPYLDDQTAANIRQLAYSHLAAVVMRKEHAFPDVQAILILSVWGLQGQGKGPDPWLLTGVVERMAHRLELQRVGKSTIANKALAGGIGCLNTEERAGLDRMLVQWKTCLTCYYFDHYLTLGFGRPQSNFADFSEDEVFLQLAQQRQGSSELASDVYIASQVQLSKVARDLIHRAALLSETRLQSNLPTIPVDSVSQMLRDLNTRLDDWDRRWTWKGARFALQMHRNSLRFAKLQGEHVRLSVNSIALKADAREAAGSEESDWLQVCVVKAMDAAVNLIDMHITAAEGDLLYSYSFEYIFNALAQAALYLIRLYLARQSLPVEPSILIHYIRSAIQVIEQTDLSFTQHSTTIAGICRDICRVAGIDLSGADSSSQPLPPLDMNNQGGEAADFDFEAFLHLDGMGLDLGFMFNGTDWSTNGNTGNIVGPSM